ncbi:MAG: hypothetical protein ACMVP2_01475 [Imperialibacter sp.]|uniref:hypothetical protein n=1 Tax=Imperialibacter sp. TaxID=2038411 RepID=UPI003A88B2E8
MWIKTIYLFVAVFLSSMDDKTPEQVAVDYFLTNLLEQDFPDQRIVRFSDVTRTDGYYRVFYGCQDFDREFVTAMNQETPGPSVSVNADKSPIMAKKPRFNSSQPQIIVHSRLELGGQFYIYIQVYQKLHFVEHYLLTVDQQTLSVTHVCKVSEVI